MPAADGSRDPCRLGAESGAAQCSGRRALADTMRRSISPFPARPRAPQPERGLCLEAPAGSGHSKHEVRVAFGVEEFLEGLHRAACHRRCKREHPRSTPKPHWGIVNTRHLQRIKEEMLAN